MKPISTQQRRLSGDGGFTLIEMMVAMLVLMVVSGTVMKGVMDMADLHSTLSNRSDMHAGVRNVTELLTQEIGQAGKIALPGVVTIATATGVGATSLTVTSSAGMFVGELLLVDTGDNAETVAIAAIAGNTLTVAALGFAHDVGDPVQAPGGFAAGVVPPGGNGSSAIKLKIFGDINSDGSMVYVEYWCDTANGKLYRNSMPITQGAKPAYSDAMVLIDNIQDNPGSPPTPCFTYQTQGAGGATYVTDVAITLTVRTQNRDRKTGGYQTETKALLNVSPRNVFNLWQLAGLGITNRVQPMPPTVTNLLP
jgi:prepilin-type N-terminal cleavage/methylation domain-containing protein